MNGIINQNIIPQVFPNTNYINDTLNWTKVTGIFKASGTEEYITIGAFNIVDSFAHYEYNNIYNGTAAYAIDDISLYKVNTKAETANCGNDTLICSGDSIQLGNTFIKQKYREDYIFEWYELGMQDSIISYKQNPWVKPKGNTTYILKLTDFKYDKTYDTININTKECNLPEIVKVYPNPTFDIVNFEFNDPIRVNTSVDLYDITGKLVLSYTLNKDYDSRYIKLNLQNLSSGMYIYSVKLDGDKEFKGKLVLLR